MASIYGPKFRAGSVLGADGRTHHATREANPGLKFTTPLKIKEQEVNHTYCQKKPNPQKIGGILHQVSVVCYHCLRSSNKTPMCFVFPKALFETVLAGVSVMNDGRDIA